MLPFRTTGSSNTICDDTTQSSSSYRIFSTSTNASNNDGDEPDDNNTPHLSPNNNYDLDSTDIDDDISGVVGELYDFDDDELLDILSDELGADETGALLHYGIGELEELEGLLQEQLVSLEEGGDGWMDAMDVDGGFGDGDEDDEEDGALVGDGIRSRQIPMDTSGIDRSSSSSTIRSPLEEALLQGVVPATAGVGSKCLPGDYGFDPLELATKDYFKLVQNFLLRLVPGGDNEEDTQQIKQQTQSTTTITTTTTTTYTDSSRPPALILRDYREAEIRHGRLAMLAAIIWPLQEILDKLFIPQSFGETTMIYGGVTLPFLSLLMTLLLMLLGYLDIYANAIKDEDAGDAFLPGECFWDPLSMLVGASDDAKREMQRRELNNGRWAMVAVFFYVVQEAVTHQPLIGLPWNQVLFEPAFEIPAVQAWLDERFAGYTLEVVDSKEMEVLRSVDYSTVVDGGTDGLLEK